jgi:protein involved in polysaccharide export with SLBB domain
MTTLTRRIVLTGSLILAGLLLAGATLAQAQVSAYQLRPGDTLEIVVAGEPTYSGTFLVGADGSILFSDEAVGKVMVAGETVEGMAVKLKNTLSQYLKNPMVSLRISKFRAAVAGGVKNPGSYEMAAGDTAMDAVARAGGPVLGMGEVLIQIKPAVGEPTQIDPNSAAGPQNLMLQPGDEVIVGAKGTGEGVGKTISVTIQGAVNNPGQYSVEEGSTFFQALVKANGPRGTADLKKCSIIRTKPSNAMVSVDMDKYLKKGDAGANPLVQEGDVLWVAEKGESRPKQNVFDLLRTVAPLLIFF